MHGPINIKLGPLSSLCYTAFFFLFLFWTVFHYFHWCYCLKILDVVKQTKQRTYFIRTCFFVCTIALLLPRLPHKIQKFTLNFCLRFWTSSSYLTRKLLSLSPNMDWLSLILILLICSTRQQVSAHVSMLSQILRHSTSLQDTSVM